MEVTFKAYVSYGKLDTVDYEVDVEITEEEYKRLVESAKTHFRFSEDQHVSDIYDKVYAAALEMDIDILRTLPEELAEKMADYFDIDEDEAAEREYTDEEITEMLESEGYRHVGYPYGIMDDLEEE